MSATSTELTTRQTTDAGDDLDHFYCCDENRSLCGLDISDLPVIDLEASDSPLCIVCEDLDDQPWCDNPDCPDRTP